MTSSISITRTNNYHKQLKGSFIFKALAVGCSFLVIPIMIKYLGNEQYGVWSTLFSIVSWIVLFDIGIGNGLRNKISESLARDDKEEAQNYISTAYVLLGVICMTLLIIFLLASDYVPWQIVFNTLILSNNELKIVVQLTASFLLINFWFSLINQVFNGLQKTSLVVFNQFLSNFFSLISTYILYNFFETSLLKLAIFYGLSLLSASFLLSIWFYNNNKEFIPKLRLFHTKYTQSILSLGFQFFIIQIAVIIIFTTDKILITQLFGPENIASYDVVFKFFSIITIGFSLINTPLWSAYSDAYHRNDFEWMEKTIKKQLKIYLLIIMVTLFFSFFAKKFINLWIGVDLNVDLKLIYAMSGFILISVWNSIFSTFINAIGKLNVQIITSIIAIFINIPLSILLVKYYGMGVYGVTIATTLSLSLFAIFGSYQAIRIIKLR